jgi:hypothetical protein
VRIPPVIFVIQVPKHVPTLWLIALILFGYKQISKQLLTSFGCWTGFVRTEIGPAEKNEPAIQFVDELLFTPNTLEKHCLGFLR